MDKKYTMTLDDSERLIRIGKALSSEVRIRMLKMLCMGRYNINELADRLEIPQSSAALNVKVLEDAGLIGTEVQSGVRGTARVCYKAVSELNIDINTEDTDEEYEIIRMPIGNYVDYKVEPTCGIVSDKGEIDEEDEPRAFYNPNRTQAQLLWNGNGYVEYRFPNHMLENRRVKKIEISAELCAEDHEYNMDYPSDISLWINGINAGTWNCPGDFGGRRGRFNPDWWPDKNTQYGELKVWKISSQGTYLDNVKVSDRTLDEYGLLDNGYITVRIGNAEDCEHKGGFNLFGSGFGDYSQDILMKIY